MNIWIFNHYATTPLYVGGTRHYDLAYELTRRGHKVTLFASSFNHFIREETRSYAKGTYHIKEDINGINYIWIKTAKYFGTLKRLQNILDYTYRAYQTAKNELKSESPDIVIGSSVHPLAAYIGYLISGKAGKPFYFEERDLWPQTFIDFGKLSKNNPLARLLYAFEKFLYRKAARIIVLFDKAADYVQSRGIDSSKVIYLPNGVNITAFRQNEQQPEQDILALMNSEKYKIIYTGSHGIANHLEPLLETAALLKDKEDIQFILVGDGLKKNDLMKTARQNGLNNVTFHDPIPKEKIPYLLSLGDLAFISIKKSPLYKWGFSMNKLYDYMAAGLPVMMYSDKETAGIFTDIYGFKVAGTPSELAEDILNKVSDLDYKRRAGENLKNYVKERYSWEKLAIDLESYILNDVKQGAD